MRNLEAGIQVEGLTKHFGTTLALDEVSFRVPPGSLCCLLGRNGAGKSTTLRVITGLLPPDRGDVMLDTVGLRDPRIHEMRRRIGYLPDQPVLYEHLTGREYLRFVADLHGPSSGSRGRIEPGLEELGMVGRADTLLGDCSLGMRKRIALLAAVIPDPRFVVLDEPTASLDAESSRAVRSILIRLRDEGCTGLFTTHTMELAERLADQIVIMRSGRLRFAGTTSELRAFAEAGAGEPLEDLFLRVTEPDPEDSGTYGHLPG